MLGIAIELILSYWMIFSYTKLRFPTDFIPGRSIFCDLIVGILWPLIYYSIYELLVAWLVHNPYRWNEVYTAEDVIRTLIYIFKSVVFEELLFRGILLFLLWKKVGPHWAIICSAVCFGIYHWFAWQAFGNPIQMVLIFLMTGSVGYVLAFAFICTGSMALPFALHLGANLATMLLFSKDQTIGPQLLIKSLATDPTVPPAAISLPILMLHFTGYQCITFLLIRLYIRRIKPILL